MMTLRAARVNKKLTIGQAADILNVQPKTLFSWEHGVTYPTVPMIKAIENLYGIKYKDIDFLCPDVTP